MAAFFLAQRFNFGRMTDWRTDQARSDLVALARQFPNTFFLHENDRRPLKIGIREEIMKVLSGSERAAVDRRNFFMTQMLFWMLAATDGHAKNFSIVHLAGNRYESTPLYDVLSAHPIIGTGANRLSAHKVKLAMAVRSKNVHYLVNQIQHRQWIAQGQRVGFSEAAVEELIGELTARTRGVIDKVSALLPQDFPMDVAEAIFNGMLRLGRKLTAPASA